MIEPKIVFLEERKVVGLKNQMLKHEFGEIVKLWKQFMPLKHKIASLVNTELIALQNYSDFNNPDAPFDIWACAQVLDFNYIPKEMQSTCIKSGLFAVFLQKGMDASKMYNYIMTNWLPQSDYEIDNRSHFQVMGTNYKNGSEDSEEDFYIPVRFKS